MLEPEALTSINPGIPQPIEEIIKKLLSKIPEARYQSSAGLKADLLRCQQQWNESGEICSFPVGQKYLQDHLIISQKLYGREEQLKKLQVNLKMSAKTKQNSSSCQDIQVLVKHHYCCVRLCFQL